jgi:glycosyltransferase involved in cell wall biosynthesis
MRVLHVHSGNLYGGVETLLWTLARCRHMTPLMEMHVALCFEGQIAGELRSAGVEPLMLGEVRLRRADQVLQARRRMRDILARHSFDVVVSHQPWPHAIFGSVVKRAGVPLVLWMHMAHTNHWLEQLAWRVRPSLVLCNSDFTMSTLPRTDAPVERVYCPVLPCAAAKAVSVRRTLGASESDVVIVQVSRMESWKGHTILIDALGALRSRSGWMCWLAGGAQRPSERAYLGGLEEQTRRIGIADRVRFLGHRADVPALLSVADVFCQPNIAPEPFGITIVEAMSAGLPVVTSGVGGAREIVTDECGVLVEPGDPAALASELVSLLDNADRRRVLGEGGRRRAMTLCDPATQMTHIAAVLQTAVRDAVSVQ